MDPHGQLAERLFAAAQLLPRAEQRRAFLEFASRDDPELRRRLEAMVQQDSRAPTRTDTPSHISPIEPGAPIPPIRRGFEKAGDRIGRYKLLEQIGEGGCGVVYVAEQETPVRRRVALKVIKLGMDTREVIARFEAERQALALMDHPNIAKVLDAGSTENGRPFFVMELVRGIRITDYCDQNQLPTAERLKLFIPVCHAVQHAHQKGIIHRDLKPSNIMVTLHDGVAVPKVIDFGIAKATAGQTLTDKTLYTAFEQFIGTPAYMSPEQAEMSGLDIDTRSDIYSLGVLLYELLTGKTPFDAKLLVEAGLDEIRRIIREEEPPRPSTKLSTLVAEEQTTTAQRRQTDPPRLIHLIRGDLDWIVMKCLEKDRTRRYDTAHSLALDIDRHLRNEPITARPPSFAYRLHKTVRRHKLAFAAAAAIVGVLCLGVAVSSWWALSATRAKREATRLFRQAEQANAEEARQRRLAEAQRQRAENAIAQIGLQSAEVAFNADDGPAALAYLAQALRRSPTNHVVADRVTAALTHRSFPLPLAEYAGASCAVFSPDGLKLALAKDKAVTIVEALSGNPLSRPMEHQGRVSWIAFSKDGNNIVTISASQAEADEKFWAHPAARVWDANTGQPITGWLTGHTDYVSSASFSGNGEFLVTVSQDKSARVWNARSGQMIGQPLQHGDEVKSGQFSPDSLLLFTVSRDGGGRVWEPRTGQLLPGSFTNDWPLNCGRFSPDGRFVAVAGNSGTAQIRDVQTGKVVAETLKHAELVTSVEFSRDGNRIVTGSWDHTARVWDAHTGEALSESLRHRDSVNAVDFDPSGERVVTSSWDGTARVWDALTGRPLTEPVGHKGWGGVLSAQFSSDGQRLVAVYYSAAQIWDVRAGQAPSRFLRKPATHWSDSLHFGLDGQRVVTDSSGAIEVWNATNGSLLASVPLTLGRRIGRGAILLSPAKAQLSPDDRWVAGLADAQKTVRVWDATSGAPVSAPMEHSNFVQFLEFSADGKRLLTGTAEGSVVIWDPGSGKTLRAFSVDGSRIRSGHFNSDGARVVIAGPSASVWDTGTGLRVSQTPAEAGGCHEAWFSPDGKLLLTASYDRTARLWQARNGQPFGEPMRHLAEVSSARFSPDGNRIVTVAADNTAQVWNVHTQRPLSNPLQHGQRVACAGFGPDSLRLVTASDDGTVRVWDAETGQPLTDWLRNGGRVRTAEFSPDGKWVATAVWGGSERFWEIPSLVPPVPLWLADVAEAVAGFRISEAGIFETVPITELVRLRAHFEAATESDTNMRWARWFFADRDTRKTSSSSPVSVADYVTRLLVQETQPGDLREAVMLSPTNRLARERLALCQDQARALKCNTEAWTLAMGPLEKRNAKRAVALAEEAVSLVSAEGSDEQGQAMYLNTLGVAYYRDGHFPNATKAFSKAAALNKNSRFYPATMDFVFLSMAFHLQGETQRGIYYRARLAEALGKTPSALDPSSASDPELRSALEEADKLLGRLARDPAESMLASGIVFRNERKLAEAELAYREAIALRSRQEVADDPWLVVWLSSLAQILDDQQKWTQAATAYHDASSKLSGILGEDAVELADLFSQEALALENQGKLAEAEARERQSLAIRRAYFGDKHSEAALSLIALGRVLHAQHRLAEAEASYRDALAIRQQVLGGRSTEVASALMLLSGVLGEEGKFPEAEASTRESLSIREEELPNDWLTFNSRSKVGSCLLALKKYAAAEPFLLSGYEGMKAREDKIPPAGKPRIKEAAQDLARLYEATGRPEQAALWRKTAGESDPQP